MYDIKTINHKRRDRMERHAYDLRNVDGIPQNLAGTVLQGPGSRWTRRNTKPWTLQTVFKLACLGAALSISQVGCGSDDSGAVSANQSGKGQSADEIASMIKKDCSASPLVGTWKAIRDYPNVYDTVTLRKDCVFETFSCGTLGYVSSDIKSDVIGIMSVVYLWNQTDRSGCSAPGNYRCTYDLNNAPAHELMIDCQLTP